MKSSTLSVVLSVLFFLFLAGSPAQAQELKILDASINEGTGVPTNLVFTVTLSPLSPLQVQVNYSTSNGSATSPTDFSNVSGTLVFPPNTSSMTITVPINSDNLVEPNETFFVNLNNPVNAIIQDDQAIGTILNDDALLPTLSINDITVMEGNSGTTNAVFIVSLSAPSADSVKVNFAAANGTATAPSDYLTQNGSLMFLPGITSLTVTIPVIGDVSFEPSEDFFVNLSGAVKAGLAKSQGKGTILNDDAAPTLSITDLTKAEGNSGTSLFTFIVSLSSPSATPVTVNFATGNSTAVAPGDYLSRTGTLTFNPGVTSQSIDVSVNGDTNIEPDETFLVTLNTPSGGTIADAQGIGTITNDDQNPPSLSIGDVSVTEGNSGTTPANFSVTLSAPSTQTITVNFATIDGTAAAGSDFTAVSGTLVFAPGVTVQSISVPVNGDQSYENDETFSVQLSGPVNALIADIAGTGTITNDDQSSPVTFSRPVPDVLLDKEYLTCEIGNFEEPSRLHQWKVYYRGAGPVTVNLIVAATTVNPAESGAIRATLTDETGLKTITVSHPATMTDATGSLSLDLVGGRIYSLTIERVNPSSGPAAHHYKLGSPDRKLELGWEDPLRHLEGHPQMWSVNADAGENVTVEFFTDATAFPPQATSITATLELPSGAVLSGPATFTPNGALTIPGFVGGPVIIRVVADGHFRFRKTSGSDHGVYALPCPELEKTVEISISDATVTEGNSGTTNLVFNVTIPAATDHAVIVNFTTTNGTASAGSDFNATTGTITFLPGETAKTIDVAVNGDLSYEPDETFTVDLSVPQNAVFLDSVAVGTIVNDDALPTLSISKSQSVVEGNSGTTPIDFTVTLSAPSPDTVSFTRTVINGTTEFGDIVPTLPIRASLLPGEVTKTITVQVNGDLTYESDEIFTVALSEVSASATLGNSVGTGTIINDDAVPIVSIIGNTSVIEGHLGYPSSTSLLNASHLSLQLSNPSEETIVVNYEMRDGTATLWDASTAPSGDYRGYNGTRTFSPGDTLMVDAFPVVIEGDTTIESNETFTINLTGVASGTATLGRTQGTVTIVNDDYVSVGFVSSFFQLSAKLPEGNSGLTNLSFDLSLSAISADTVTVDYSLEDSTATGTALPGIGDYYKVGGTVTFLPGEGSKKITVGVNGDTTYEPDEVFHVTLSNPRHATIANSMTLSSRTTGTIENDDPLPKFPLTITRVGIGGIIRTAGVATECDGDNCSNDFDEGSTATLTAIPKEGWRFVRWEGARTDTTAIVTVTMDAAKSITAIFERITHALSILRLGVNGDSGIVTTSPAPLSSSNDYYYGTSVTLTAVPDSVSTFTGWSGAASGSSPTASVTMDADKSVTATFTRNKYTLTVNRVLAGGSVKVNDADNDCDNDGQCSSDQEAGSTVTLTAVPKAGWRFTGWTGAVTSSSFTVTVTMDAAKSITAVFERITYTLSVAMLGNNGGLGTVTSSPAGIDYGSGPTNDFYPGTVVTLTATPDTNSTFTGWSGAVTGTSPTATVTMDASRSVTARFDKRITHVLSTFTIGVNGGSGTIANSPSPVTGSKYYEGTTVTLTATPNAGSTFVGWSGAVTGTSPTATVTMDADKSVTATFEKKKYTLTITRVGIGGTVRTSNDPDNACDGDVCTSAQDDGATITLTALPRTGWRFVRWEGACTGTDPTVTLLVDGAKAVRAVFERTTYTLSVAMLGNNGGLGTVTSSPAGIDYGSGPTNDFYPGTVVTLTATPDANSTFTGWSGDATGTGTAAVTMDANKSVTATFDKKKYSLTIVRNLFGGIVRVNQADTDCDNEAQCSSDQAAGTAVILTAVPKSGWRFVRWDGDCSGTGSTVTVTMDAAKNVTAVFARIVHSLTVTIAGTAFGSVSFNPAPIADGSGSNNFYEGTVVTLTAIPDSDATFSNWDTDASGTLPVTTLTMDSDKHVGANFLKKKVTLTITRVGVGGSVRSSNDPDNACDSDGCTSTVATGSTVTLTAIPKPGWHFVSWACGRGTCDSNEPTLTVTIDGEQHIIALFEKNPEITINNASVIEGDNGTTSITFTLSLSNTSHQTVSVSFSTADGTATVANSDYGSTSGIVLWSHGDSLKSVAVLINGDNRKEPDETFTVNLSSPLNSSISSGRATGTIINDDALPRLSISNERTTEGNGGTSEAVFSVQLSKETSSIVRVRYTTADVTARAGVDYSPADGQLVFNPGERSRTIVVAVRGDNINEPTEKYTVTLSEPENADLGDPTGIGTIIDDDPLPSITINDTAIVEGNSGTSILYFTLTLSNPSADTIAALFTTSDGTATYAHDYNAFAGTVTFLPGDTTARIPVLINGDTGVERDETFTVDLSHEKNSRFANKKATGTILNDDAPTIASRYEDLLSALRGYPSPAYSTQGRQQDLIDGALSSKAALDNGNVTTARNRLENKVLDHLHPCDNKLWVTDTSARKELEKQTSELASLLAQQALMLADRGVVEADEDVSAGLPAAYGLGQNFPNPFNPTTTIQFDLPEGVQVSLKVYDMLGREVVNLVEGERAAGRHSIRFDASRLTSGIYLYRIQAGKFSETRKLMLVK